MTLNQNISYLLERHIRGELTESEQVLLNEWIEADPENRSDFDEITDPEYLNDALGTIYSFENEKEEVEEMITEKIKQNRKVPRLTIGLTVAASILVVLAVGVGYYFWAGQKKEPGKTVTISGNQQQPQPDVTPGGPKATLTLADGRKIILDSAIKGQIAQQGGTTINNNTDGKLAYNVTDRSRAADSTLYNTLETEKGQTYTLALPDGSRVWLNAESSISYPVAFDKKERRIKFTGEAYFEIKKQSRGLGERVPFAVTVADSAGNTSQEVEVLGTHFNINAYKDENNITTTLLEGKVRLRNGKDVTLDKPNQQSVLSKRTGNFAIIKDANVDREVAWKNGYFNFKSDSMATVLKQIARWYDVDYVFDKRLSSETFTGKIMRNLPLSKVVRQLSLASGIQFVLHYSGKRIAISPEFKR